MTNDCCLHCASSERSGHWTVPSHLSSAGIHDPSRHGHSSFPQPSDHHNVVSRVKV